MKKRFLSVCLAMISTLSLAFSSCSLLGGSGANASDDLQLNGKEIPDYSESMLQYDFYGYSSASNGVWNIDGVNYTAGEDFRTVERIKEYNRITVGSMSEMETLVRLMKEILEETP